MVRNGAFGLTAAVALVAVLGAGLFTAPIDYWPAGMWMRSSVCDLAERAAGYGEHVFPDDWYLATWGAAGEPALSASAGTAATVQPRVVRFTWIPSNEAAVIVRVEFDENSSAGMTATELFRGGGVARRISRSLTRPELASLLAELRRIRPLEHPPRGCSTGLDGAQWIVESIEAGRYRYVDRWSPERGPIRDIGLHMLRLTGWRTEDVA